MNFPHCVHMYKYLSFRINELILSSKNRKEICPQMFTGLHCIFGSSDRNLVHFKSINDGGCVSNFNFVWMVAEFRG